MMTAKSTLIFGLVAVLSAGCGSKPKPNAPDIAAAVGSGATVGSQVMPATAAPRPGPFTWLEHPSATPTIVIGVHEVSGILTPEAKSALVAVWMRQGADAALLEAGESLTRSDVAPARISPNISVEHRTVANRTRFLLLKFRRAEVFQLGFWDDQSDSFVSGSDMSLYRFEAGRSYETFGRYVVSPFAPKRPPVNVVGLPDGAVVVCPYTNRPFTLW